MSKKEKGANSIVAYITHGVFSGKAIENLLSDTSPFSKIYIANTIPFKNKNYNKLEVLDMSFVFTKVIKRVLTKGSVSSLFM